VQARKELEGDKSKYARELEKEKSKFARELEGDKSTFMRELEDYKVRLANEKAETERQLSRLEEAQQLASDYRTAVGLLREGLHQGQEIDDLQKKLASARDRLEQQDNLRHAWMIFSQRGHNLNQRAKTTDKSAVNYINIWQAPDDAGKTFGLEFADSAEKVMTIIRTRRMEIIEQASRTKGP
jgi:multidrug resistance efflux pump